MGDRDRNRIFISYSHRDSGWLDKLQTHLTPYLRSGTISPWADTQISPGGKWAEEIDRALLAASVAVLLVSPDFLASDFIVHHELPNLLRLAQHRQLPILWVAVTASAYQATELREYQALNDPSRPLDSLTISELNKELVRIAERIAALASDPQKQSPPVPPAYHHDASHPPRVFISYSRDSDEHANRVRELADRLRGTGINASVDQYLSMPSEGWVRWTEQQVESSDFVLIVSTEQYWRRFEGQQSIAGAGVEWEGLLIYQHLYNERGVNSRFIPVLLNANDINTIPVLLRGLTIYVVAEAAGYDKLCERLLNPQSVTTPVLSIPASASAPVEPRRAGVLSGLRVFLCHSSADKVAVRSLYLRLRLEGAVPWFDEENLIAGQDWEKEITKAIRATDVVLVCLSKHSVTAVGYLKREIGYALDAAEQRAEDTIFLIPVRLEDCPVPERLQRWHWVNLFEREGYSRLLRALEERAGTAHAAAQTTKSFARFSVYKASLVRYITIRPSLMAAFVLIGLLTVYFGGMKLLKSTDSSQFSVTSAYLTPVPHIKNAAVVFVHGIFGDKDNTWRNGGSSFPSLLGSDPEFRDQLDIFTYEYFTPKFGSAASIVSLADQLRGSLDDNRVFDDHQKTIFLAHSMGGIIVRQFLLSNRDRLAKVPMLYFAATPTNGSELTLVAKELSGNPQLRGMLPIEGNDLLQSIQSGWLGWDEVKNTPSYCSYETLPTEGVMVVSMSSATALCNRELDPISANHIDIVKPRDRMDSRYMRFATALRRSLASPEPQASAAPGGERNTDEPPRITMPFVSKVFDLEVCRGKSGDCGLRVQQTFLRAMETRLSQTPFLATKSSDPLPMGELRMGRRFQPSVIWGSPFYELSEYLVQTWRANDVNSGSRRADDSRDGRFLYASISRVLARSSGVNNEFVQAKESESNLYVEALGVAAKTSVANVCTQLDGAMVRDTCTVKFVHQ